MCSSCQLCYAYIGDEEYCPYCGEPKVEEFPHSKEDMWRYHRWEEKKLLE